LHKLLADNTFYERGPRGFTAVSATLGEAQRALSLFEERWLELVMLREDLTQQ